uniref:D-alanyl-D-alanine carboxypeptidase-like core domain-containing protein n=1 Tax=candidate division CPR3 bacterium TaxID=2268181 RepID=A0A7V3N5U1_UNCC3
MPNGEDEIEGPGEEPEEVPEEGQAAPPDLGGYGRRAFDIARNRFRRGPGKQSADKGIGKGTSKAIGKEAGKMAGKAAGKAAGTATGTAAGAAVGSAVPVVGTIIGGAVGAIASKLTEKFGPTAIKWAFYILLAVFIVIVGVAIAFWGILGGGEYFGKSPFRSSTEPAITEALAFAGDPIKLREYIYKNTDTLIQEITTIQNDAGRLSQNPNSEEFKSTLSELKTVLLDLKASTDDAQQKKKLDEAVDLFQSLAYFSSVDTNEEEIAGKEEIAGGCPTPSGGLVEIGNGFKLKEEAANQLRAAQEIAKNKGLELEVRSAYRSYERQKELWDKAVNKYGSEKAARKWVAKPSHCTPHATGGAVDIRIKGRRGDPDGTLEKIMCEAGWVRYKAEWWHFEYKTKRWQNGHDVGACAI